MEAATFPTAPTRVLVEESRHFRWKMIRTHRPSLLHRIVHWFPALAVAALIFWLSHQSRPPGAEMAPAYVGHFLIYGLLTVTLVWGITEALQKPFGFRQMGTVWLTATLYGVTDEFHQSFIPERHPSVQDVIVNSVGSIVAALLCLLLLRWWWRLRTFGG